MRTPIYSNHLRGLISGIVLILSLWLAWTSDAQVLNLPPRPADARGGNDVAKFLIPLQSPSAIVNRTMSEREIAICGQILQGNVPNWMRQMALVSTNATINGTGYTVSYYVTPDYLAIGSDDDYFLTPMTPLLGQLLANRLGCSLPTSKMVNDIWKKAPCKLAPSTISPSPAMTTVPVFMDHNTSVRAQRVAVTNTSAMGTLTGGDKKDVILANKIYTNFHINAQGDPISKPVVIYGWHYLDGSRIQPVYNGHGETYADYSHGIRLVQMGLTVNGQSNTVTNVLQSGSLAALLSDDTTYASNVIAIPRYPTFVATAPIFTLQPRSQTVPSNSTVTINAFAVGDVPMTFQWKRNGANVPGATNALLTLSNVQDTATGTYTLFATNAAGWASCIPAILNVRNPSHPTIFADDFETNSSARWTLSWGATNNVPDYTVDWAYDYGGDTYTFGGDWYFIPPAPNSASKTRGVRLTVNNNDSTGCIAGINLYAKNQVFSNDYALKFDMWLNYPGGAGGSNSTGSTQHALCGINHFGTNANWSAPGSSITDGLWFGVSGEGGDSRDYRAYVGNPSGTQTELLGAGSGLSQSNNTAAVYQTLFPSSRFETAGAPGKQWVQVEVRQAGGVITWLMDGTVVAQRNNTSAFTKGTVMIGLMDVFNSIANPTNHAFVLFDNLRVEDLTQTLQAPAITTPPQNQQCSIGSNVTFTVAATGTAPLSFQWFRNGAPLTNAVGSAFSIGNVQAAHAGTYSVTVSNIAGTATAAATLSVTPVPAQFHDLSRNGAGEVTLTVSGSVGQAYLLEASTNLLAWEPLLTLTLSNGLTTFTDLIATNFIRRFYRASAEAIEP